MQTKETDFSGQWTAHSDDHKNEGEEEDDDTEVFDTNWTD